MPRMRRLLLGLIPVIVIGAGFAGGYAHLLPLPHAVAERLPGYLGRPAHDPPAPPPWDTPTAVTVTMPAVESNLGVHGHFIQVVVSFAVTPAALKAAGATAPTSANSGTVGTSSVALNNRIEAMITTISRATSFSSLQTPAGVNHYRAAILAGLQHIFGPHQVGNVLFPTLLTQ